MNKPRLPSSETEPPDILDRQIKIQHHFQSTDRLAGLIIQVRDQIIGVFIESPHIKKTG